MFCDEASFILKACLNVLHLESLMFANLWIVCFQPAGMNFKKLSQIWTKAIVFIVSVLLLQIRLFTLYIFFHYLFSVLFSFLTLWDHGLPLGS